MKEINFNALKDEIFKRLKELKEVVISTSYKDQVTSRTVYCYLDNDYLHFITSKAYTKYRQISRNPNVALCSGNMQIEGIAEIMGHPKECEINIDDENTMNYVNHYGRIKNTVLIRVRPTKVILYKGQGYYQYLHLAEEKAFSKGSVRG